MSEEEFTQMLTLDASGIEQGAARGVVAVKALSAELLHAEEVAKHVAERGIKILATGVSGKNGLMGGYDAVAAGNAVRDAQPERKYLREVIAEHEAAQKKITRFEKESGVSHEDFLKSKAEGERRFTESKTAMKRNAMLAVQQENLHWARNSGGEFDPEVSDDPLGPRSRGGKRDGESGTRGERGRRGLGAVSQITSAFTSAGSGADKLAGTLQSMPMLLSMSFGLGAAAIIGGGIISAIHEAREEVVQFNRALEESAYQRDRALVKGAGKTIGGLDAMQESVHEWDVQTKERRRKVFFTNTDRERDLQDKEDNERRDRQHSMVVGSEQFVDESRFNRGINETNTFGDSEAKAEAQRRQAAREARQQAKELHAMKDMPEIAKENALTAIGEDYESKVRIIDYNEKIKRQQEDMAGAARATSELESQAGHDGYVRKMAMLEAELAMQIKISRNSRGDDRKNAENKIVELGTRKRDEERTTAKNQRREDLEDRIANIEDFQPGQNKSLIRAKVLQERRNAALAEAEVAGTPQEKQRLLREAKRDASQLRELQFNMSNASGLGGVSSLAGVGGGGGFGTSGMSGVMGEIDKIVKSLSEIDTGISEVSGGIAAFNKSQELNLK